MKALLINYDTLKKKAEKKEDSVLSSVADKRDVSENHFKFLTQIMSPSIIDVRKPYTVPAYIYNKFPVNLSELVEFSSGINVDLDTLFSNLNKFNENLNLVLADTEDKYIYKGTGYLGQRFSNNYLLAKYAKNMLIFDNFQNVNKNIIDQSFFVDRSLGFMTKGIQEMTYFEPVWQIMPTPDRVIKSGQGFYPTDEETKFELFLSMPNTELINFMFWDMEFPGDQFIDEINYIKMSVDGVNYIDVDPTLLKYINESFTTIYDQNFFKGFIPFSPTFAKYVKIGFTKKTLSPDFIINDILFIRGEYKQDLEQVKLPILYKAPYISEHNIESSIYKPWSFNYYNAYLTFEQDSTVFLNLEMSFDRDQLDAVLADRFNNYSDFVKSFYAYMSPILFDYSVFLGF